MKYYNQCVAYVNELAQGKILNAETLHPWRRDGIHVLQHALRVHATCLEIQEKEEISLSESEQIALEVSALLHDIGKFIDFNNHAEAGAVYSKHFLSDLVNDPSLEKRIGHTIQCHSEKVNRDNDLVLNILKDADVLDEVGIQSFMMCSNWVDQTTPFFFRDLENKLINQELSYVDRIYKKLYFKSSKSILDQRKHFLLTAIEQLRIENKGSMTMEDYKVIGSNIMEENLEFYEVQGRYLKELGLTGDNELVYAREKIESLLAQVKDKPKRALELGSGRGFDAVALSLEDVHVDAIEYVATLADSARALNDRNGGHVNFITGDFYTYQPKLAYDLVYYLDGFGVSDDHAQGHLLDKIYNWMTPEGTCILEVYHPDYWQKTDGQVMQLSEEITRTYGYDYDNNAFTDTWCKGKVCHMQALKCYGIDEMKKLLSQHHLKVVDIVPGGALDYKEMIYHPKVSLDQCMSYTLFVEKAD